MGDQELYFDYRQRVMDYMEANREAFEPFIEDDVPFDKYVSDMRKDAEWGGHLELQLVSLCFSVNIIVHQLGSPPWEIRNFPLSAPVIHLSYHDGEHYASVRCVCKGSPCVWCWVLDAEVELEVEVDVCVCVWFSWLTAASVLFGMLLAVVVLSFEDDNTKAPARRIDLSELRPSGSGERSSFMVVGVRLRVALSS